MPNRTRASRVALGVVLATLLAMLATLLHHHVVRGQLLLYVIAVVLFAAAVLLLIAARLRPAHATLLVVAVGALLQLVATTSRPQTSDDAQRYIWDAKVQLSGIDPYRYVPQSPELRHLRSPELFGPSSACTYRIPDGCTTINRPSVHTVYPPVAEATFSGIRLLSVGGHGDEFPYQLAAALGCIAITVLLARRRPAWLVALWAWCPVVVLEFGNNAHIDWLAVLLAVLALRASAAGRDLHGALLVGAAIATKLYPGLLLPAMMRRRPWMVPITALATVALVYLPHVLAVGSAVVGYLPGYLREEGYDSGKRLLLLGYVLPHPIDTIVGAVILAAVSVWAWRRADPAAPEHAATIVVGTALLVATPSYGWYAGLLVALVVVSARWEWMPIALAGTLVYLTRTEVTHRAGIAAVSYLGALLLTVAAAVLRRRLEHAEPRPG